MFVLDSLAAWVGMSPLVLCAAVLISTVGVAVQGTIGFGFGLLSVPTLALMHPGLAPVPQLLLALPLAVQMAWQERAGIDWTGFGLITAGRFPGTAIGIGLVGTLAQGALDLVMAGIVALAVVAAAARARVVPGRMARFLAGVASGVMSYVSAIGGPPVALLYRDASGPTLRATLAMVFTVGLVITLVGRAVVGQISEADLRVSAVLAPSVVVGLWVSRGLVGRVEGARLRGAVLVASGLAAAGLAARTLIAG